MPVEIVLRYTSQLRGEFHAGIERFGASHFLFAALGTNRSCLLYDRCRSGDHVDGFFRFDWIGFLCFGLYYLLHVPMQKDEARKAYFSKPRTIVSSALLIAVVASALHTLHDLFTKHRF